MQQLALQIRELHAIRIDQSERADAGSREIKRGRRTEAARADAKHARSFQAPLAGHRHLRHDEMTRIARAFFSAQGNGS